MVDVRFELDGGGHWDWVGIIPAVSRMQAFKLLCKAKDIQFDEPFSLDVSLYAQSTRFLKGGSLVYPDWINIETLDDWLLFKRAVGTDMLSELEQRKLVDATRGLTENP